MKTKLIVISIVSAAILLLGASRIAGTKQVSPVSSEVTKATVGGIASEEK